MTYKEKKSYEKIFLEVWDNDLLEKDLLMDMCELLEMEKRKNWKMGSRYFIIRQQMEEHL